MFPLTNANHQRSHSQPGGKQQAHRHPKDKQPGNKLRGHAPSPKPEHRQHARSTRRRTSTKATSSKLEGPGKLTDSQRASGTTVSKLPSDNQQASCATDSQPIYVNWVQTPRWPTVMCQTNLVTSVNQTDSRRTSSELKGRSRQVADSQVK